MPTYRVELASTGRAGCKNKECQQNKEKILKGELRLGTFVDTEQFQSWAWKHWGCVTPKQVAGIKEIVEEKGDADMTLLDGYDELPAETQKKISDAVEQGHVDDEDWKGDVEVNRPGKIGFRVRASKSKEQKEKHNDEDKDEQDGDEEEEKEEEDKAKKTPKRQRAKKKTDEVDDEEEKPSAKKAKPAPKASPKATPKKSKAAHEDDEAEPEAEKDGEDEPSEKKKKPAGRKSVGRASKGSAGKDVAPTRTSTRVTRSRTAAAS